MKRLRIVFFFLIGIPYFYSIFNPAVYALDDDVVRLQKRVTELEAKVKELESLLFETNKKDMKPALGWQNKMNWRRLTVGMNQNEVKGILGEPIKIIKGVKTLWYYPNIYCGYTSFDEKGRLVGWNEP